MMDVLLPLSEHFEYFGEIVSVLEVGGGGAVAASSGRLFQLTGVAEKCEDFLWSAQQGGMG